MKKVHEGDFEWRNGDSGVKYLMRGPSIDWGLILLKPGEAMASAPHGHEIIDETFYFMEGNGLMIIDGTEHEAPEGSVFLCEPGEMHNIRNDSEDPVKVVFIKGDYKPDDKIQA
jgi:mannose-6-phosphate isomerase-like protein (cupin superfamily)